MSAPVPTPALKVYVAVRYTTGYESYQETVVIVAASEEDAAARLSAWWERSGRTWYDYEWDVYEIDASVPGVKSHVSG